MSASVLPYEEAVKWCSGDLPSYISKVKSACVVKSACMVELVICGSQ